jgi:hypothetical protein
MTSRSRLSTSLRAKRSNPLAAANTASKEWIASSQVLLAMTAGHDFAISLNTVTASQRVAMTLRHTFAISPAHAPRVVPLFPALSELRAQGMPGARCARGLVCNGSGRAHTSIQVTPESPGIPHAMVYGLYRALPGAPGVLATVASGITSANLTPASGCQDHTFSPSASTPFVIGASASTASRPAAVTIATRPSVGRDSCKYSADFHFGKAEYFF